MANYAKKYEIVGESVLKARSIFNLLNCVYLLAMKCENHRP